MRALIGLTCANGFMPKYFLIRLDISSVIASNGIFLIIIIIIIAIIVRWQIAVAVVVVGNVIMKTLKLGIFLELETDSGSKFN